MNLKLEVILTNLMWCVSYDLLLFFDLVIIEHSSMCVFFPLNWVVFCVWFFEWWRTFCWWIIAFVWRWWVFTRVAVGWVGVILLSSWEGVIFMRWTWVWFGVRFRGGRVGGICLIEIGCFMVVSFRWERLRVAAGLTTCLSGEQS